MGPVLAQDVQNKLLGLEGVDDVASNWSGTRLEPGMMTEAAKLQLGFNVMGVREEYSTNDKPGST